MAEPKAVEAGRNALIETVAALTGVSVDHYAEIGLLGFSLITDALGGVEVCLKKMLCTNHFRVDFPGRLAAAGRPAGAELRPAAPTCPRRSRPSGASAGGDGVPGHEVISSKALTSPATMERLRNAIQRSVVISSGWDVMNFLDQLQKLAAGNVAFATIPVLKENGWSGDGMQSVVTVDPTQVQEWVANTDLRSGRRQDRGGGLLPRPDHRRH